MFGEQGPALNKRGATWKNLRCEFWHRQAWVGYSSQRRFFAANYPVIGCLYQNSLRRFFHVAPPSDVYYREVGLRICVYQVTPRQYAQVWYKTQIFKSTSQYVCVPHKIWLLAPSLFEILYCTVFKIDIFARNTVGHNNPMIALTLAISGPTRGAKNSCSLNF